MKILKSPIDALSIDSTVVTVGTFDGIHRGHREIIERLKLESKRRGAMSVLATFEPHPRLVIQKNNLPPIRLLTTTAEKAAVLEKIGIDTLFIALFTPEFAATPAEVFVRETLVEKLRMKAIIIGHDHAFGRNREGNEALLQKLGRELNFDVYTVEPKKIDDRIISSTAIRHALMQGDVQLARLYLGRPYCITGRVIEGRKQGRRFGYPTANILPNDQNKLLPKAGIYATFAEWKGEPLKSVTYIGARPTFGEEGTVIEVHINGFDQDIYGEQLTVCFYQFLRNDKRFDSKTELVKTIEQDKINAMRILDNGGII